MRDCFKIYGEEDIQKVFDYLEKEKISFNLEYSINHFIDEEAPFRIKQVLENHGFDKNKIDQIVEDKSDGLATEYLNNVDDITDNDYLYNTAEKYLNKECGIEI